MKNLTTCLLALLIGTAGIAQSKITSISFNKMEQPALMLELPYNEDVSQDFIVASLKKTGYNPETKGKFFWKQNKTDGFYIFKEVKLEGLKQSIDLYFRVDQKGRRSKDESVIFMMVSKEEGSFVSEGSDESTYNAAKKFLNGFVAQAAAYKLDLEIQDQEDVVKDAEKKLDKLQGNEKDLSRKIEQLQKELNKNKDDQNDQGKTIDKEKKKLNELKAQAKDL